MQDMRVVPYPAQQLLVKSCGRYNAQQAFGHSGICKARNGRNQLRIFGARKSSRIFSYGENFRSPSKWSAYITADPRNFLSPWCSWGILIFGSGIMHKWHVTFPRPPSLFFHPERTMVLTPSNYISLFLAPVSFRGLPVARERARRGGGPLSLPLNRA